MKEIIIVYGNMGSGKSTFSKALKKQLPSFQYICLDDYRRENFAEVLEDDHNTYEFEHKVARETKAAINTHSQIIYETTGGTRFFKDIYGDFVRNRYKLFIIKISCPAELCLERHLKREKDGHFHVVPHYKKRLGPKEYINQLEDRSAWIKPDIVLDSKKYGPEELIKQFYSKYNANGGNPELEEILKKFDYQTALKWFNDHVEGKFFVKEMLSSGEDDFNRARLKKELHQVLESMASPERSRREQIGRDRSQSEQNLSHKPNTPPPPIKVTEHAAITPEALQLKEKWRPLYSHAANIFARLDYIQDDEERRKACFEILDTMDEVQTIWAEADYIKEYGQKPDFGDKGMDDMTPEQMATRIRTLRTYISKAKKGKLNADNIPTWEAEKQELERRMKQ